MPAAVRGAGRRIAKARSKSSASPLNNRGKPAATSRFGLLASPKFILPVLGLAILGVVSVAAVSDHRASRAMAAVRAGAIHQSAALGLRLDHVALQGASPKSAADILRAAALPERAPLLTLDLAAAQHRIEQVGWVKSATVMRLYPDSVLVAVQERHLVAVWQHDGRAGVVDSDGQVAGGVDPNTFPSLPLVVGDGANLAAAEIIPRVMPRSRLADRLEAFVRVDDRRWDLRLKDGAIIQLPATDEEAALIRLDQLDQQSRILDLGLSRIDLRDPEMVLVRPRPAGVAKGVSDGAG